MLSSNPIYAEVPLVPPSKLSDAGLEEACHQDEGSGSKQEVTYYPYDEESNRGSSDMEIESLSEDGRTRYQSSPCDKKPETTEVVLFDSLLLRAHCSSFLLMSCVYSLSNAGCSSNY